MYFDPEKLCATFNFKGKGNNSPRVVNGNLMCICPFRHFNVEEGWHYEKNPSFGVDLQHGKWRCFSCETKGVSLTDLAALLHIDCPPLFRTVVALPVREVPIIRDNMLGLLTRNNEIAMEYLRSRGIFRVTSPIGASDDGSVLYFPIFSRAGKLIAWAERYTQVRQWGIQPEGVSKDNLLYGVTELSSTLAPVYVVESVIDKLKLQSWGFQAVATCGAGVVKGQLDMLLNLGMILKLIPHRDTAGDSWFLKIREYTKKSCLLYGINLPQTYKDVGDVETKDIFLQIEQTRCFMLKG